MLKIKPSVPAIPISLETKGILRSSLGASLCQSSFEQHDAMLPGNVAEGTLCIAPHVRRNKDRVIPCNKCDESGNS